MLISGMNIFFLSSCALYVCVSAASFASQDYSRSAVWDKISNQNTQDHRRKNVSMVNNLSFNSITFDCDG